MQRKRLPPPLLLTLILGFSLTGGAARAADQVGRYQLAVSADGRVYVLDTLTGDCWSKLHRGRWVSEGNPTRALGRHESDEPAEGPITLRLPRDEVELTIHQRDSKAIPGSDDRLFVRLGDITGGQVLVTVETDDGEVLLDERSLEQGDEARFRVGGRTYSVRIKDLRNLLTGNDFAILEVAADEEDGESSRREAGGATDE